MVQQHRQDSGVNSAANGWGGVGKCIVSCLSADGSQGRGGGERYGEGSKASGPSDGHYRGVRLR